MLYWTQMTQKADDHLGWSQNGQRLTFETSDVTWPQRSTLVYTLNPELMHGSIVTDVQMC